VAARQALDLLPEQDYYWRGISLLNTASETLLAGRMKAARTLLLEVRALSVAAGNGYGARAAAYLLGEVCIEQGELHQAAQLFRQVLDEAGEDRLDQSHALIGLATLAYEWNDLESAAQSASQAFQISRHYAAELGEQLAEEMLIVPASLLLARVAQARGDFAKAQERLQALRLTATPLPLLRMDVRACQARLALATGDVAAAERWRNSAQESAERFPFQQEREARLSARVMIARGKLEDALRLLEPWQADAHNHGRTGSELEILALMALAHFVQGDHDQAVAGIVQSLTLAQPGGYQRLFLDEGERMAALLRSVYPEIRDLPLATYVRKLLLAFAEEPSKPFSESTADEPLLIEPLSAQEERILRLLDAGLSNPEIAQTLIVSVNTVKTQVQSIYRKLDVHSREEASSVARKLGLI
jgi:LuxR family maltose regulon positive regulatory protein